MAKTEPSVRSNHDFDMHREVSIDRRRCYTNVSTLYVFRSCSWRVSCCSCKLHRAVESSWALYNMKPLIDKCSAAAEMGYRLATIYMGQNCGVLCPPPKKMGLCACWGGGWFPVRLPCEFGAYPFSVSRDISYTNKNVTDSAKSRTLRSSLRAVTTNATTVGTNCY